mmetsp:Transcript_81464/g.176069  ORF Transcript_81464/g.176069 Transcript_81464/m.176069 type:complete len:94 (+) Transcript_81464:362-643(+)
MNSGAEAGESSIKIARRWAYQVKKVEKDQAKVVFMTENFWGRTLAACASTDDEERYRDFGPFPYQGFDLLPYNDVNALKQYVAENHKNLAAVH